MDTITLNKFAEHISYANNSIKLFVRNNVFNLIVEDLFTCLKKSLALELYISNHIPDQIEDQPFLITKIYRLREAGASIYRVASDFAHECDIVCQIDFKTTLEIKSINGHVYFNRLGQSQFEFYKKKFEQNYGLEYRQDVDDIGISFQVESAHVIKNSSAKIQWHVTYATRIEIDGIGEVPAIGSRTVTFLNDTVVNIRAFNQRQRKIKSLYVQTINQIEIDFDLQVLNPASNEFYSLKDANSSGVYGIYKGNKIKLIWNVRHADEVVIRPFGVMASQGEHVFSITDSLELTIQAIIRGKTTKSARIIIHEFPVNVFKNKLVSINEDYLPKVEINIQDKRAQAYSFLNDRGYLKCDEVTKSLRKHSQNYENELFSFYNRMEFHSFYQRHSLSRLNRSIKDRLLFYFRHKPAVLSMVNLMLNQHD